MFAKIHILMTPPFSKIGISLFYISKSFVNCRKKVKVIFTLNYSVKPVYLIQCTCPNKHHSIQPYCINK